ncbi:conjugative transfer signal peptidase TraF [Vibrio parahaemolyticus]|nr:conjugative transfer signal peptidase TraF [Vibrio parahaemolyticus]
MPTPYRPIIQLFIAGLGGTFVLLCAVGVLYLTGIRYNHGGAYPAGFYQLQFQKTPYARGDLVLFCPPTHPAMTFALNKGYALSGKCPGGWAPAIQKIAALSGDRIAFEGDVISINGLTYPQIQRYYEEDLPRLASLTLRKEEYFMLSDHLPMQSFDSRYYGPVHARQILGHVRPLWTW